MNVFLCSDINRTFREDMEGRNIPNTTVTSDLAVALKLASEGKLERVCIAFVCTWSLTNTIEGGWEACRRIHSVNPNVSIMIWNGRGDLEWLSNEVVVSNSNLSWEETLDYTERYLRGDMVNAGTP